MSAETRIVLSSSRVVVASLPQFDDDDDAKLPINRTPIANTPFSSPSLMRNSLTIKTKSETHRRSLHARYCEDFLLFILLDDPVFAALLGTEAPIPSLSLSSSSSSSSSQMREVFLCGVREERNHSDFKILHFRNFHHHHHHHHHHHNI